ncbi:MSC_0624 family F1-like ATPase-associated membrane protein [Mycoplasmopsis primatum]|uniref:MSC_0624 family F1-like ATPase-associated membrane protein n=1 Tax=Mycoplasmopsis primatum TaxID=55604 RepID=UPI000494F23C|nr:hypothetical protein [Mycoplasmopsis primatum]
MNNKNINLNNTIYEDESTVKNNTNNTTITKVMLYFLRIGTIILLLSLLLFINKTILPEKMLLPQSWTFLFNYQSQKLEQLNYLIIWRAIILMFVFTYSLVKNHNNVYANKLIIKKYIPWFILYLLLTISSFTLLFTYTEINTSKLIHLINILTFVFVINLSYTIYNYLNRRKKDPIVYKHKAIIIIPVVSQFLLLSITYALFYSWIFTGVSNQIILYGNPVYKWLNNIFMVQKIENLFLLLLFILTISLLLVGSYFELVYFIIYKKINTGTLKNRFYLMFCIIFSLLLWFIKVFLYKQSAINVFEIKIKRDYLFFLEIAFLFIILGGYIFASVAYSRTKFYGSLNLLTLHLSCQLLIWMSLLTTILLNSDLLVMTVNTVFASLVSLIIFFIYWLKNKNVDVYILVILFSILVLIGITLFVFGINYLLSSSEYNNYYFMTITYSVSIVQILLIINVSLFFVALLAIVVKLFIIIFLTKNIIKENNEKTASIK